MEKVVIIPALNPGQKLRWLVEKNWEMKNQVILVDDGSQEKYQSLFRELGEKSIVLHHKRNLGKGEAIKTALTYIRQELWECDVIGIMDADGQHLPEDMEKCLQIAYENPEALILGVRLFDKKVPWTSRIGNKLTGTLFRLLTGVPLDDTQTGLRAFSVKLLHFMQQTPGSRYEYEMNVLMECARRKIELVQVPVETIYHDKNNSCSHFRKVRDSIRIYSRLFHFLLSSLSSFLLDYILFALFLGLLPPGPWAAAQANIGARILSGWYNYKINCRLVFQEKESLQTAGDYLALAVIILFLNSLLLQAFIQILCIPSYPAKIMTEISLFLLSWLVQEKWIFPRRAKNCLSIEKSGERI